jgi:hypothetical protein
LNEEREIVGKGWIYRVGVGCQPQLIVDNRLNRREPSAVHASEVD